MQKILLASIVLLFSSPIYAQFSKGTRMLSGSFYLNQNKQENTTTGNVAQISRYNTAGITMGVSIFDNASSFNTFSLLYNRQESKNDNGINLSNAINQAAGLGCTHTKLFPLINKLSVSLGAGGSVLLNNNKTSGLTGTIKSSGFQVTAGVSPGLLYQMKPRLLLQAQFSNLLAINYSYLKSGKSAGIEKSVQQSLNLYAGTNLGSVSGFGIGFYWLMK